MPRAENVRRADGVNAGADLWSVAGDGSRGEYPGFFFSNPVNGIRSDWLTTPNDLRAPVLRL